MSAISVIVANEPRSYREVMAATFIRLRPEIHVYTVEPDHLDAELARLKPHMVVCSRLSEALKEHVLSWILLYPDGEDTATTSIAGIQTEVRAIGMIELFTAIDQTMTLASAS